MEGVGEAGGIGVGTAVSVGRGERTTGAGVRVGTTGSGVEVLEVLVVAVVAKDGEATLWLQLLAATRKRTPPIKKISCIERWCKTTTYKVVMVCLSTQAHYASLISQIAYVLFNHINHIFGRRFWPWPVHFDDGGYLGSQLSGSLHVKLVKQELKLLL